jgi:protein-disulfide isomerase
MKNRIGPLLVVFISVSSVAVAQKTRRATVPQKPPVTAVQATPSPQPPPTTPAPSKAVAVIPLVVVNGQTFTTEDLDPSVRQQLDGVAEKIVEAKRSVLDLQINTMLLEAEAKRRGVDTHRLYEVEVTSRIPAITPNQVKKFFDDNKAQFEGVDQTTADAQVRAYLHDEAESRLADAFVDRLRKAMPVSMGVDITSPNLASETVLATVGGLPLKASQVIERLKPIIYKIQLETYNLEKQQADQLVDNQLLMAEAKVKGIGPEEIIRSEISDKVRAPTDDQVAKFYNDNKARINGDLNTVRNQVAVYLQEEDRRRLEKELSQRLRKNAQLRWLITEPAQPVQIISVDDDPSIGPATAAVTIVEFTDFQCPACAAMHPVLNEVLKSYGDRVRFVVRDFPLNMHEWARKAAEAANAARAQGKFFEYAALLFQRQKALDVPSLKKYAGELGLNRAKFDAELDRGIYAAEVQHDVSDGEMYGVGSTPTIFINGVMLKTLSADALREAIDRAAATAPKTGTAPSN